MGQWNPSTQDNCYSSKLPMGPIRKLAGYHSNSRCYFNTRATIMPSENLLRLCPIGKWSYNALDALLDYDTEGTKQTAVHALKFFNELNVIFLQDAAAMMILHPERETHQLFGCMPFLFMSDEWLTFKARMHEALQEEECPMDAKLEHVIPGLHQWQSSNHNAVKAVDDKVDKLTDTVVHRFEKLESDQAVRQQQTERKIASTFMSMAQELLQGGRPTNNDENSHVSGDLCDVSIELGALGEGIRDVEMLDLTQPMGGSALGGRSSQRSSKRTTGTEHLDNYRKISMLTKHQSLSDLWDEWHGEGKFVDPLGGIEYREKTFGPEWRKDNKAINGVQFSRTKRIVSGIKEYSAANQKPELETIAELEEAFKSVKGSVGQFVSLLQVNGFLKKKAPRGARGIRRNNDNE